MHWNHHEFLQLAVKYIRIEILTLSLDPKTNIYTIDPECGFASGNLHCFTSLRPASAPMVSNREILMAFKGANLDFAANNPLLNVPSFFPLFAYIRCRGIGILERVANRVKSNLSIIRLFLQTLSSSPHSLKYLSIPLLNGMVTLHSTHQLPSRPPASEF